ncbi:MAG TPA: SPOR domain-containing protein [Gemmatimonadales bacterium]|nr:SPOR domain-containing protein [Gemmatimonadales bacterium]
MKRLLPLLALLPGCSGSRSGAPDAIGTSTAHVDIRPAESARSIPIVALRVLAGGGALRAYLLPALTPASWAMGGRTSPVAAVIGMDDAGRRLIYRDSSGLVEAFDLVAYRERPVEADSTYVRRGAITTLAPDGTLYAVLPDGAVIESAPWGASEWPNRLGGGVRDAFPGVGGSLIAIRHAAQDTLALASREAGISLRVGVPTAVAHVASRDGDAVAFVTDSGLVVVEEREPQTPWFVRVRGSPVTAAFTPSGHRIYVALRARRELAAVDRFTRHSLASVTLPGSADALRMDPWGRAVLVHPADAAGDETWIVSVADNRLSGRVSTRWASDLPTASENGVLLAREGANVVARDIRSLDSLGTVVAGAADLWFVGRWKPTTSPNVLREESAPRRPQPAAAAAAAPRRSAPAPAESAHAAPAQRVWVQVSVSQNEKASRELAAELDRTGHAAQVIAPRLPGEGWRVVVGPYPSRSAADSAGRLLGRPYYILEPGPEGPLRP